MRKTSARKVSAGKSARKPARMFRTNLREVPKVGGLKRKDGWVDMQVQFLIDKKSAGANHVVGWTVLKPGARHETHRHHNCDEFFIVLKGHGHIYTDEGQVPSGEGDVVYHFIARSDGFAPFLDTMLLACVGTDPECLDTGTQEKTGTLSYSVTANVEQTIYLHAFADARGARGAGFISAFADPVVVVDPTFAGASEYTISFSPGVSAPVPEPGGWLLTGLGLGVLAWRGTRRRH